VLFGRIIGNEMKAHGLHYTPHYIEKIMGDRRRELVDAEAGVYRFDQLLVLKQTRVPAVLLEAGSIINRAEEWQLRLPRYRAQITSAVADAVDLYCKFHPPTAVVQVATRNAPHKKIARAVPTRPAFDATVTRTAHATPQ
jgi:hypothetical protein